MVSDTSMKVCFLIRNLDDGGAQRQVVALTKLMAMDGHNISICLYYSGGIFESEVRKSGVKLYSLGKKGRWDIVYFGYKLMLFIRKNKPDIVHPYLGTANILSVLVKLFQPRIRIVWGIRASNTILENYDWFWRLSYFVEKLLSRFADLIIVNSVAGMNFAVSNGFPSGKMVVVPNGIDTDRFFPYKEGKKRLRTEWSLDGNELLIGMVARLDPKKDHVNFFSAAAKIVERRKNVKFICIGRGDGRFFEKLRLFCEEHGLAEYIIWGGTRNDMESVYNALDLLCLSSAYGEGFPNVLGEAMACGIPCVATDVGDSALIIGDTGITVPPREPDLLAEAMEKMIDKVNEEGIKVSMRARHRIVENFGVERMVLRTKTALLSIIQ